MSNLTVVQDLTPEQIALVKSTVAKNATDDELRLFLYRAKSLGLDPLKPGQIHFVKYQGGAGTIIIGREGFRSKAAKTGKHTGTKVGILRDDSGRCLGAWAEVYRADWVHPAREEVSLAEYNTGKGNWARMQETMIKKVAEVAALRMAFPDELGGIYEEAEMDQAEPIPPNPLKEMRVAEELADVNPSTYMIKVGKYKDQKIADVDMYDLANYVSWLTNTAKEKNKPLMGNWLELVTHAEKFFESRTPQPIIDAEFA